MLVSKQAETSTANATILHVVVMSRQGRKRRCGQDVRHVLRRVLVYPATLLQEQERDNDNIADLHCALGQQELRRSLQAAFSGPEGAQETRDGLFVTVVL